MARLDKLYIGTNTKMYKTIADTISFLTKLEKNTEHISRDLMQLFVIPSYTTLDSARKSVSRQSITLGAQNMGWESEGQYTGEISPLMLKETGTELVMIGHSERRNIFGETNEEENKKVLCALAHDFTPLLCIGERADEKDAGIADEILSIQLKTCLQGVTAEQAKQLMVAYEPVWAIGVSGIPATKEYAEDRHREIRQVLLDIFGKETGSDIPVLYGGSVNPGNAADLIRMPSVDGLFIGRSAWDADNFTSIIQEVLPLFSKKRAG